MSKDVSNGGKQLPDKNKLMSQQTSLNSHLVSCHVDSASCEYILSWMHFCLFALSEKIKQKAYQESTQSQ